MISVEQIKRIYPFAGPRASVFCQPLNDAMGEFGIDTPTRQAAFLAQIGHESGQLRYVEEIASGAAYEGRKDLGNVQQGDGVKFKGHGLIQITGRANHAKCSLALFGSELVLLANPRRLCEVSGACRSAAWFWQSRGLNELADDGQFEKITRRINGGLNGQAERLALWEKVKEVLNG